MTRMMKQAAPSRSADAQAEVELTVNGEVVSGWDEIANNVAVSGSAGGASEQEREVIDAAAPAGMAEKVETPGVSH